MDRLKRDEQRAIPAWFDYAACSGLSREMVETLGRVRPRTLGQASRIQGVTPAAVTLVNCFLENPGPPPHGVVDRLKTCLKPKPHLEQIGQLALRAPTARAIPAQGAALGLQCQCRRGLKARPIRASGQVLIMIASFPA